MLPPGTTNSLSSMVSSEGSSPDVWGSGGISAAALDLHLASVAARDLQASAIRLAETPMLPHGVTSDHGWQMIRLDVGAANYVQHDAPSPNNFSLHLLTWNLMQLALPDNNPFEICEDLADHHGLAGKAAVELIMQGKGLADWNMAVTWAVWGTSPDATRFPGTPQEGAALKRVVVRYAPYLARKKQQFAALERLFTGVESGGRADKLDAALLQEVDFLDGIGNDSPLDAMWSLVKLRFLETLRRCGFAVVELEKSRKQACIVYRVETLAPLRGGTPEGLFPDVFGDPRAVGVGFTVLLGVKIQLISAHLEHEEDCVMEAVFSLQERNRQQGFLTCLGVDLNRAQIKIQEMALIADRTIPSVVHKTLVLRPGGVVQHQQSLRQNLLRVVEPLKTMVRNDVAARSAGFLVGDTDAWLQTAQEDERRSLHLRSVCRMCGGLTPNFESQPLTHPEFVRMQRAARTVAHFLKTDRYAGRGLGGRSCCARSEQIRFFLEQVRWESLNIVPTSAPRLAVTEVAAQRFSFGAEGVSSRMDLTAPAVLRVDIVAHDPRRHGHLVDPGRLFIHKAYRGSVSWPRNRKQPYEDVRPRGAGVHERDHHGTQDGSGVHERNHHGTQDGSGVHEDDHHGTQDGSAGVLEGDHHGMQDHVRPRAAGVHHEGDHHGTQDGSTGVHEGDHHGMQLVEIPQTLCGAEAPVWSRNPADLVWRLLLEVLEDWRAGRETYLVAVGRHAGDCAPEDDKKIYRVKELPLPPTPGERNIPPTPSLPRPPSHAPIMLGLKIGDVIEGWWLDAVHRRLTSGNEADHICEFLLFRPAGIRVACHCEYDVASRSP